MTTGRRTAALLAACALLGAAALLALAQALAALPGIDARWQLGPAGEIVLASSDHPALAPLRGRRLLAMESAGRVLPADAAWLRAAPRWNADETARRTQVQARRALSALLAGDRVTLHWAGADAVGIDPRAPRAGLGAAAYWLLALPALGLALLGLRVLLQHRRLSAWLFAIVAGAQSLALLALGADLGRGIAALPSWWADDLPWRAGLDLASAAAALHLFALHPTRLRGASVLAGGGWALAALTTGAAVAAAGGAALPAWWLAQGTMLLLVAGTAAVLAISHRQRPHPFSAVMRRLLYALAGALALLVGALAAAGSAADALHMPTMLALLAWTLFVASFVAWLPFLLRGRPLLPEIALVAALATVTASLQLLLDALTRLDALAAALLAVALALASYALVRRWLVRPLTGRGALPAERVFEHLVRAARELVDHPDRYEPLLGALLRELFDPHEVRALPRALPAARVMADGAALAVPVRSADDAAGARPLTLVLRFARRGRRLFTLDDARLADDIAEQLRRAAAYELAVEHGRSQERSRIAQDLHDDIGARLLTLMYRAQDPEVESYLRHTLQDLKTLTRGLATREHRLSHAAAEWKADLQHRLEAAQVDLEWSFDHGADPLLGMGQWSALTRILRELATNAMAHARATRLEVSASLRGGVLALRVADDGCGRAPETWAPGLGLGGVRKRVRQLGGRVQWHEGTPGGIVCEVELPLAPPP